MRSLPSLSLMLLTLVPVLGCGGATQLDDDDSTEGNAETEAETEDPEDSGPECSMKFDCPLDMYCKAGTCVPEPAGNENEEECWEDSDCPEGLCVTNVCVAYIPPLDACDPIELISTEVFALGKYYAWAIDDVDGQPGDEIVIYQPGEIVSIAAGVPTLSPHPVNQNRAESAVLLHADGDGMLDLIVSGATQLPSLIHFLGEGTGAFSQFGQRNLPTKLYRIGKAAAPGGDAVFGRVGGSDEHAVFIDALALEPTQTLTSRVDLGVGDLDGDGVDELAAMMWGDVQIYARDQDNNYTLATTVDCRFEDRYDAVPFIADINADGLADLLCFIDLDDGRMAVTLHESLGNREFSTHPTVRVTGHNYKANPTLADLDGDGTPELVFGPGRFVRLGADGNLGCELTITSTAALTGVIKAGDLDGDGRDELVTIDSAQGLWIHALP